MNQYYKANTGFFLFCFFVLFGIVSPDQVIGYHSSLIQGMIQSFVFLGCVIIVWTLYAFKCVRFMMKQIAAPRQTFLFVLNDLPSAKQRLCMLFVHLQVYAPVLIYAGIVASAAIRKGYYGSMGLIILSSLILIAIPTLLYTRQLQRKKIQLPLFFPSIRIHLRKPLAIIPLLFLWKTQRGRLLATKLFTFFLLFIFIVLNEPENNDVRPLLMVLMLVSAAHCSIILQQRLFEEEYLGFSRNFPVHLFTRFLYLIASCLLLLLPELLFVWRGYPLQFAAGDYLLLLLFTISLPVLFYSILLMNDIDDDSYLRIVFAVCAALFFVILYGPGILFPLGILALAFVFFSAHFNTFEKKQPD